MIRQLLQRILEAVEEESIRAATRKSMTPYLDPNSALRILMEEVGEVAEEINPYKIHTDTGMDTELIQVASVAINWLYQREIQRREQHAVRYESKFQINNAQANIADSGGAGGAMGVGIQGDGGCTPLQDQKREMGGKDGNSERGAHGDVAGGTRGIPAENATITDRVGEPPDEISYRGWRVRPPTNISLGNRTYILTNWDRYTRTSVYRLEGEPTPPGAHGSGETGKSAPRDRGNG